MPRVLQQRVMEALKAGKMPKRFYAIRTAEGVKVFSVLRPMAWPTHDSFDAAKKDAIGLCENSREIQRVMKLEKAEPHPLRRAPKDARKIVYSR